MKTELSRTTKAIIANRQRHSQLMANIEAATARLNNDRMRGRDTHAIEMELADSRRERDNLEYTAYEEYGIDLRK